MKLVASTTIVGDVVRQVAGDEVDLTILVPLGVDPHTFDPRPQDIAAINEAEAVFINGIGLEEALEPVLDANLNGLLGVVSENIPVLEFSDEHIDGKHKDEIQPGEGSELASGDPHTWMDPNNVIVWAQNIADSLTEVDPQNAALYQANAAAYIAELRDLDRWIIDQVNQVPPARRELVTDHAVFGYFAEQYGFEQVGLVVPAFSTNATASAHDLADLEEMIRARDVRAIFVGKTVNPALSEQVALDTGTQVVSVYTGSLGETGSAVDSYLKFMRYNVTAIVNALKP